MPIRYYKLFDQLQRRGLKKTDLIKLASISSPTVAKLSKGETVTTEIIEKVCNALELQPGDIMEVIKAPAPAKQTKPEEPAEEHITLPWEE